MNTGDTAFLLICSALVFFMTPGLAFFYGGLVRRKNVVNTMMACAAAMGISVVLWVLLGYTLSFSGDTFGIIGDLTHVAMSGISKNDLTGTVPTYVFAIFQMMFAMITPALLTGSVAGRMRFRALALFLVLWSVLVYYPMAHMVWGGGLLAKIGSVDFAGGNVVHISSGVSGLVLALLLGRRRGVDHVSYRVHNIPFVFLGAAMLWFGWFGFNAGSALKADGLAAHAFLTSAIASACALLSWLLLDVVKEGKPTLVGASTGLVVGLVAITPGAGYVPVWAAFVIGLLVSPICYFGMRLLKGKLKVDDALDAFGCHGIGGIWGGIATGLFAQRSVNGVDGLVFGGAHLFWVQLASIGITIAVAVAGTLLCAGVVRLFTPLRVEPKNERLGMDSTQHGESAYPTFTGLDA